MLYGLRSRPDGIGDEPEVDERRQVAVAVWNDRGGGRVSDHRDLEALFDCAVRRRWFCCNAGTAPLAESAYMSVKVAIAAPATATGIGFSCGSAAVKGIAPKRRTTANACDR